MANAGWVLDPHMGYSQEACDAAVASALETATKRHKIPERVTIFTDVQAAVPDTYRD